MLDACPKAISIRSPIELLHPAGFGPPFKMKDMHDIITAEHGTSLAPEKRFHTPLMRFAMTLPLPLIASCTFSAMNGAIGHTSSGLSEPNEASQAAAMPRNTAIGPSAPSSANEMTSGL